MSFSGEVKKELLTKMPDARHCMLAELSAYLRFLAPAEQNGEGQNLTFFTENKGIAEKLFTLVTKTFKIDLIVSRGSLRSQNHGSGYIMTCQDPEVSGEMRKALMRSTVVTMDCCRRSFLRGAFLAAGSISAPEKYYHLEIVCPTSETADFVRNTMRSFALDAKIVLRKKDYVVYIKEGEQILTMLGEMGATSSFLTLENIRVVRDMRGNVNRRVNCETANLSKTVMSSVRQIEDIQYLKEHGGYGRLPEALKEMAEVRLQYPDAPLSELGRHLSKPLGKSGVNHRLKKLSQVAEKERSVDSQQHQEDGS
ncbi:MAG: DNA-binding protein WhiA [Lachnospiraceae bacterium]|nr:DNA-binding protein WhiA [Lachnospiraceae bacterium]